MLIQRALQVWPGFIKDFDEDKRRHIAEILEKAQETLNTEGTPIWVQLNAIIQLLVPSGTVAEEGEEEEEEGRSTIHTTTEHTREMLHCGREGCVWKRSPRKRTSRRCCGR